MQSLDQHLGSTTPLRDNTARGKTIYLLMMILLPLTLLSILSDYQEFRLIERAMQGEFVSDAEATSNDLRQAAIGFLLLGFNITLIVTFIQWFRRAYYNAHALKIPFLTFNEGRAAGGWFIPFANLYQPYKIATEIWDGYHYALERWLPGHQTPGRTFIIAWWTIYLITNIIANVASRWYVQSDTLQQMYDASLFSIISSSLGLTSIIAVLIYIRKMRQLETQLITTASEQQNNLYPWVDNNS